jgi:hypothetical protein
MYLHVYYSKMVKVVHSEKPLIHFFYENLIGKELSWHMYLDNTKIRRWRGLVDVFIKHYKFNMDMALGRSSL